MSKSYTIQQPKWGALAPDIPLRFESEEEAKTYKARLIRRMEFYVQQKTDGHAVGNKTLKELQQEVEDLKALEIVKL